MWFRHINLPFVFLEVIEVLTNFLENGGGHVVEDNFVLPGLSKVTSCIQHAPDGWRLHSGGLADDELETIIGDKDD